jgi:hypothetical protein
MPRSIKFKIYNNFIILGKFLLTLIISILSLSIFILYCEIWVLEIIKLIPNYFFEIDCNRVIGTKYHCININHKLTALEEEVF